MTYVSICRFKFFVSNSKRVKQQEQIYCTSRNIISEIPDNDILYGALIHKAISME